eukprot:251603-Amorphochlora_amoeboformis.AAC.1
MEDGNNHSQKVSVSDVKELKASADATAMSIIQQHIAALTSQLENRSRSKIAELTDALGERTEENKSLKASMIDMKVNFEANLKANLKKIQSEKMAFTSELESRSKREIADLREILVGRTEENNLLKMSMAEMKARFEEKMKANLEKLESERMAMTSELETRSNTKIAEINEVLGEKIEENKSLQASMADMQALVEKMQSERITMTSEENHSKTKMVEISKVLGEKIEEIKSLKESMGDMQAKFEKLESAKVKELQEKDFEIKSLAETVELQSKQIVSLNLEKKFKKEEVSELKLKLKQYEGKVSDQARSIQSLQLENDHLDDLKKKLSEEVIGLREHVKSLATYSSAGNEASAKVKQLEEQVACLQTESKNAQARKVYPETQHELNPV